MLKRTLDILLATCGLALLWPVLAAAAIWIKLESPGPVLYLGSRVGRNGRPFRIAKFRSMVVNADKLGGSSTADDDPRLTRVGRLLRRFKIDELPQLFNVLDGSMSLVGPRPQVAWAVDLYTPEERQLLSVRPGITDYASLMFRNEGKILEGSADPDRDYLEKIAPRKLLLGLEYIRHHGPWTDLKIIVATALAILGVDPDWCLTPQAQAIMHLEPSAVAANLTPARAA